MTRATCAAQAEMNRVATKVIADQALLLRAARAQRAVENRKKKADALKKGQGR